VNEKTPSDEIVILEHPGSTISGDYRAEVTSTSCPSCAELREKLDEFKYELFRRYRKTGRTMRAAKYTAERSYLDTKRRAFFEVIKLFVATFPTEHPEPVEAPTDFFEEEDN